MIIIFELGFPICWKPHLFKSTLSGKPFRRFTWLFFAVAYYPGDFFEYSDAVRSSISIKV